MIWILLLELVFQPTVQKVESQNVRLYYSWPVTRQNAHKCLNLIQEIFEVDAREIQYGWHNHVDVRLCRDYLQFTQLTGFDSAFAPSLINNVLYVVCPNHKADSTLLEKLSRGVLLQMLTPLRVNGLPWWLMYSAAIYKSGELQSLSPVPFVSVDYLNDLEERVQNVSSGVNYDEEALYYLGITGKFIEVRFGAGSIARLLHEFTASNTFDSAIKKVLHVDKHRFEDEWRKYLKEQVGKM